MKFILGLILILPGLLSAQVILPSLIGDSMVLQQKSKVPLWGKASVGSQVTVKASWDQNEISTVAGEDGNWKVHLITPAAGGPFSITINERILKGVMTGEVWLCSGQSNMQWTVEQSDNADKEIAEALYPGIRFFYVARETSAEPKKDCYGHWESCYPGSVSSFSAVAYYFGRVLNKKLGIPIGLIHSSWGGTPAEAWTKKEILESDNDLRIYIEKYIEKIKEATPGITPLDNQSPSALYNAMIAPLIPFVIKGVIWYQGEANRNESGLYEKLLPALIGNWRQDWGLGDFPFYYVQIAPFDYDEPMAGALLRDAQRKTLSAPNTGMVVTLDIGNPDDIHPTNKQDVGKRLALWALAKDYNIKNLVFSGPVYRSMSIEDDKVRIQFDHTGSGLFIKNTKSSFFEIAGIDKVFKPATCEINGESLLVYSNEVSRPIAVRYSFHNTDEASLFNLEGLPASSFRTDDWPILTAGVTIKINYDSLSSDFRVSMENSLQKYDIRYTTDGSEPKTTSKLYISPFVPRGASVIKARAFDGLIASVFIAEQRIERHLALGKKTDLKFAFNPKYSAGGKSGLIDGVRGSKVFMDGAWQGFDGKDLELVVDLGAKTEIHEISAGFLQVMNSWIFFPEYVEFSFADDGKKFSTAIRVNNDIPLTEPKEMMKDFTTLFKHFGTRYIKIYAKSIGVCPEWHPGAGEKAWIFVDEIIVR